MKAILLIASLGFSMAAFASPADNCLGEAEKSSTQAIESRFEGNETYSPDAAQVTSTKLDDGFEVVTSQKTTDHHRGGGVDLHSVIKVSIIMNQDCGEISRTITKRTLGSK